MAGCEIMKRFEFDPHETLRRVRAEIEGRKRKNAGEAPTLPIRPIHPTRKADDGAGIGEIKRIGTPADQSEKVTDAVDHFEERAAIREYDGCQHRREAEREAMIEADRAAGIGVIDLRAAIAARRKGKTWER